MGIRLASSFIVLLTVLLFFNYCNQAFEVQASSFSADIYQDACQPTRIPDQQARHLQYIIKLGPSAWSSTSWPVEPSLNTISVLLHCFITIGLCILSVVYFDLPESNLALHKEYWRKIGLSWIALFFPELNVATAFYERLDAQSTLETGERLGFKGWSLTSAYLANSRNLIFQDSQGGPSPSAKVLRITQDGEASMDNVDRYKANTIARAVVLMQSVWFTIQSLGRLWASDRISSLEIYTTRLAILAVAFQGLSWRKPVLPSPGSLQRDCTISESDNIRDLISNRSTVSRVERSSPKDELFSIMRFWLVICFIGFVFMLFIQHADFISRPEVIIYEYFSSIDVIRLAGLYIYPLVLLSIQVSIAISTHKALRRGSGLGRRQGSGQQTKVMVQKDPFSSSKDKIFQFEYQISRSIADSIKGFIQQYTEKPIIWWPLSESQRPLSTGMVRVSKQCLSCFSTISLDISIEEGEMLKRYLEESFEDIVASPFDGSRTAGSSEFNFITGDEPISHWKALLQHYCQTHGLRPPVYTVASDRRGGRTAWSCSVVVYSRTFNARYWYDGSYIGNAKEDCAQVAVDWLYNHDISHQGLAEASSASTSSAVQHPSGGHSGASPSGPTSPSGNSGNLATPSTISSSHAANQSSKTNRHPRRRYPSTPGITSGTIQASTDREKYFHWCVDSAKTLLHDICVQSPVEAKTGRDFVKELRKSYRRLRGIRWWLSFTDCANVKLVKFVRLLDNKAFVTCQQKPVSIRDILTTGEYDIDVSATRDHELHIAWAEATLAHYLTHKEEHADQDIDTLLSGLPKRKRTLLRQKAKATGYGMHAQQGWSVFKFLIALAICSVPGLAFFFVWIKNHPGDLQNASVPYFMILATVAALVAIPDLYMN